MSVLPLLQSQLMDLSPWQGEGPWHCQGLMSINGPVAFMQQPLLLLLTHGQKLTDSRCQELVFQTHFLSACCVQHFYLMRMSNKEGFACVHNPDE